MSKVNTTQEKQVADVKTKIIKKEENVINQQSKSKSEGKEKTKEKKESETKEKEESETKEKQSQTIETKEKQQIKQKKTKEANEKKDEINTKSKKETNSSAKEPELIPWEDFEARSFYRDPRCQFKLEKRDKNLVCTLCNAVLPEETKLSLQTMAMHGVSHVHEHAMRDKVCYPPKPRKPKKRPQPKWLQWLQIILFILLIPKMIVFLRHYYLANFTYTYW